jgi:hypothetical protein
MSDLSNYLENELLDHLRGSAFTAPTNLYLGLHTGDPTDAGGNERALNGNGYTRQTITFNAASAGSMTSNADVSFTASGGSWGTITHSAVYDGTGAGANMLWYSNLTASRTIDDTDTLTFASGQVSLALD